MPNINTSSPPITSVKELKLFGMDENEEVGWIFSNSLAPVVDYAAGIEITQYSQLVRDENGEFWRVSGQVDLPYVTTGAGIPEDDALVPVGDAVLRQALANPNMGAAMVARGVVAVDSIADLLALPEGQRKDGLRYLVKGYHAGSDKGGGEFYWDVSRVSENDGGSVINGFTRIFNDVVTPEMFGATGDASNSASAHLENSLVFASRTGRRFSGTASSTYLIDQAVSVNREGHPSMSIDWGGATLICQQAGISISGAGNFLETRLAADAARGDSKVQLVNTTGVAKGDQLAIISPAISVSGIETHHYYVVSKVEDNTVFIDGLVVNDIKEEHIAATGATGDIKVYLRKLSEPLTMSNGKVVAIDPLGKVTSILIGHQYRTLVDNMQFEGHCRNQLYIQYGGYDIVRDCHFRDYGYIEGDTGYSNLSTYPDGLGYGYGVIHSRNYRSRVVGCTGGKGWHLTDASRGQMHITYESCTSLRNGFGFSTHENAWDVTYIDCHAHGQSGFTLSRAHRVKMIGCSTGDKMLHNGVVVGGALSEVTIEGCTFMMNLAEDNLASAIYQGLEGYMGSVSTISEGYPITYILRNSRIIGRARNSFGVFSPDGTSKTTVTGNIFENGAYFYNLHGNNIEISDNIFNIKYSSCAINLSCSDDEGTVVVSNNIFYKNNIEATYAIMWRGSPARSHVFSNKCIGTISGGKVDSLVRLMEENISIGEITNNSGNIVSLVFGTGGSVQLCEFNTANNLATGSVDFVQQRANIIDGVFTP